MGVVELNFELHAQMSRIEARLKEREEARKAAIAARRLEKQKESRAEETYDYFSQQFSLQVTGVHASVLILSTAERVASLQPSRSSWKRPCLFKRASCQVTLMPFPEIFSCCIN